MTSDVPSDRVRRSRRASLAFVRTAAVVAGAAFACAAAVPPPPVPAATTQEKVALLPRAATSSDGAVRVIARDDPRDTVGFRNPLLHFASGEVNALRKAFGLPTVRLHEPCVIVRALDGRTNDTRVVSFVRRRPAGLVTFVDLPSPGHSDIDRLRFEIAKAVFRRYGGGIAVPDWFAQGALRACDVETTRADTRLVLTLWRSGRLPFFPALCTDLRVSKGRAAALSGYVAAWTKEKGHFAAALKRMRAAGAWDGRLLATELTGASDPIEQDRRHDERLVRLVRTVLAPGTATAFELDVFASHLQLNSPLFDRPILGRKRFCTFREAATLGKDNLVVRLAAFQRVMALPYFAYGRGDALKQTAEAYVTFLTALGKGETDGEGLCGLLDDAEAKLALAYESPR